MSVKRKSSRAGSSQFSAPKPGKMARREEAKPFSDGIDGQDCEGDDFDDGENLLAAAAVHGLDAGSQNSSSDIQSATSVMMDGRYEHEGDEDGFKILDSNEEKNVEKAQDSGTQRYTRSKRDLYSLPTNEEMQGLRETGELFKTNILKLQIEEMLASVRPRYHKSGPMELVLRRLHALLQSLQDIAPVSVSDAEKAIQILFPSTKVSIPFCDPRPKPDAKYKFAFQRPSSVQLVGSWPLRAIAERPTGFDVDLAVVMPSMLFQEKDYLNFRYFHKRAFYLEVLAAAISHHSKDLGVILSYGLDSGDVRRPLLILRPIADKSEADFKKLKAEIRVHIACDFDIFPLRQLAPSKNNIRTSNLSFDAISSRPATPHYNAAIIADSVRAAHLVYLHATMKECAAFNDTAMLLRVWAFQRGFGSGSSASSKQKQQHRSPRRMVMGTENARFLLTMVLAHLLHGEEKTDSRSASRAKLSNGFSSYQLFRGVIDWLATHDFVKQPVFMKSAPTLGLPSKSEKMSRSDFIGNFSRVFVDPSGTVNLLAQWLPGSFDLLQYHAKLTFAMLDDAEMDHFDDIFLIPLYTPSFTFDEVLRVPLDVSSLGRFEHVESGNELLAGGRKVTQTLNTALQSRCRLNAIFVPADDGECPLAAGKSCRGQASEIGLIYDAAQAFKLVEHGPHPEDKAASKAFQQFWGDVAELRRFKDGRILHSIVWEIGKQSERWSIPRRIIRHALARHNGIKSGALIFTGEPSTDLLTVPESVSMRYYLTSPEEKGFQLLQSTYDTLARQLRAIDDLPLALISIAPADPGLCSMSTFVPAALDLGALGSSAISDCASYLPAHEIVLTFESSGRWPDELKAIQAMKLAFCERLATLLPIKVTGLRAHVALDVDATQSAIQDQASLELILPSGFAFRARIHHERERVLLQRIIADKRNETISRRSEASQALERFERRFMRRPSHHAAMATLSHRYTALSDTVRLLKRWVRAHMLDGQGHVPEEALELLALSVFICPGASCPSTGSAGFLQCLHKLCTWKWREEPLLIPVQSAITLSEHSNGDNDTNHGASDRMIVKFPTTRRVEALEAFKLARSQDPSLSHRAWFLSTEHDVSSQNFSSDNPSGATAHALQGLAAGAVKVLKAAPADSRDDLTAFTRSLFTPGLGVFDFIIHLNPTKLPRYAPHFLAADPSVWLGASHGEKKIFRNAVHSSASAKSQFGPTPRPGFDSAASFVGLLRGLYSDTFRLYHDPNGSPVIGGIFNPLLAGERRRFKVAAGFNSLPEAALEESQEGRQDEKSQDQVRLNTRAVLAEVERLGEGLIESVEVKRLREIPV